MTDRVLQPTLSLPASHSPPRATGQRRLRAADQCRQTTDLPPPTPPIRDRLRPSLRNGHLVTDICGNALDFSHGRGLEKNKGIVCAPPRVHGLIIRASQALGIAADA
jgi:hypothetical protein